MNDFRLEPWSRWEQHSLGNYATSSGNSLPTFWYSLSDPSSMVKNPRPLKMGPINFPETSVKNYQYSLCMSPAERCTRHSMNKAWFLNRIYRISVLHILCYYHHFFSYYIKILASRISHILCSTVDSLEGILALCLTHHHSLVTLTTGTKPFQKRVLHTARSSASFSSFQIYVLFLVSSNICLCLLPPLPITSTLPYFFFIDVYKGDCLQLTFWRRNYFLNFNTPYI